MRAHSFSGKEVAFVSREENFYLLPVGGSEARSNKQVSLCYLCFTCIDYNIQKKLNPKLLTQQCLRTAIAMALYFGVVHPIVVNVISQKKKRSSSNSEQNFLKCGTNVHLDSSMNCSDSVVKGHCDLKTQFWPLLNNWYDDYDNILHKCLIGGNVEVKDRGQRHCYFTAFCKNMFWLLFSAIALEQQLDRCTDVCNQEAVFLVFLLSR